MTAICKRCGCSFERLGGAGRPRVYCFACCSRSGRQKEGKQNCDHCGHEFEVARRGRAPRFCCAECRRDAYRLTGKYAEDRKRALIRDKARYHAAAMKIVRHCKTCGNEVAKQKQFCDSCRTTRHKECQRETRYSKSNRAKGILPAWEANFRRDEQGKPIEKRCTKCDQWLPVSFFRTRKDTASGVTSRCDQCSYADDVAKSRSRDAQSAADKFFSISAAAEQLSRIQTQKQNDNITDT